MTEGVKVAALLVTHNSERFLGDTLASIDQQSRRPDVLLAVDDHSSDATTGILANRGFTVAAATSSAIDTTTRVAQNFQQGLRLATGLGATVVILGDHDDIWHPDRVRHQVEVMIADPAIALLASDGFLIDEHGAAVRGTIRSHFPMPPDFNTRKPTAQVRYALRHSIATGGACAVRPSALPDWAIPAGWLHDRWWSLAALRAGRFRSDPIAVIDYRLSSDQQVGLHTADQQASARWITGKVRRMGSSARRLRDLSRFRGS